MADLAEMTVSVGVDTQPLESGLSRAKSTVMSSAAVLGGALAAVGGVLALKHFIGEAQESAVGMRKLEQTLKTTNGAAGVTAKEISDIAGELQNVTNFSDDATVGAAGLLATFTQIKGDEFKQAIPLIQDLAEKMGGDLNGAALQVGKALNDPVAGITALSRSGVSFSETQKQQIKGFVETNQLAKAQQMILGELAVEFGGTAKAGASSFTILENQLSELAENIGRLLLPAATKMAEIATSLVQGAQEWTAGLGDVGDTIGSYVLPIWNAYVRFVKAEWQYIAMAFQYIAGVIESRVIPVFQEWYAKAVEIFDNISGAASDAVDYWGPIIMGLYTDYVEPAFAWIGEAAAATWGWIGETVSAVLDTIGMLTYDLAGTWELMFTSAQLAVYELVDAFWNLVADLQNAWDTIQAYTVGTFQFIAQYVQGVATGMWEAFKVVGAGIGNVFIDIYNSIMGFFSTIVDTILSLIGGISFALGGALVGVTQKIKEVHNATLQAMGPMARTEIKQTVGGAFGAGFDKNKKSDYMDLVAGNLSKDIKRPGESETTKALRKQAQEQSDALGKGWEDKKAERAAKRKQMADEDDGEWYTDLFYGDKAGDEKKGGEKKGGAPAAAGGKKKEKDGPMGEMGVGAVDVAKKIQDGILGGKDKIQENQLSTLQSIDKKLDPKAPKASLGGDIYAEVN